MTEQKKLLNEMYSQNKTIIKSLQRISNMGLIALIMGLGEKVSEEENPSIHKFTKICFTLSMVIQCVLLVWDFVDIKKAITENSLDEE